MVNVYMFYGLENLGIGLMWQVQRLYNVGGKFWNSINSMNVKSSLCKSKKG